MHPGRDKEVGRGMIDTLLGIGIGSAEDPSSGLADAMAYIVGISKIGLGVVFLITVGLFPQKHAQRWDLANIGLTLSGFTLHHFRNADGSGESGG